MRAQKIPPITATQTDDEELPPRTFILIIISYKTAIPDRSKRPKLSTRSQSTPTANPVSSQTIPLQKVENTSSNSQKTESDTEDKPRLYFSFSQLILSAPLPSRAHRMNISKDTTAQAFFAALAEAMGDDCEIDLNDEESSPVYSTSAQQEKDKKGEKENTSSKEDSQDNPAITQKSKISFPQTAHIQENLKTLGKNLGGQLSESFSDIRSDIGDTLGGTLGKWKSFVKAGQSGM